jgi:signal transduction histidine kinase
MKQSLSTKWFFLLTGTVVFFSLMQLAVMVYFEFSEVMEEGKPMLQELEEIYILFSVSVSIIFLMLGLLWFISRKMITPIRAMAITADRIGEGDLADRIERANLDDELGILADALNKAFDKYQDSLRRLEKFAGNAAHQLRTPLATIRSLGEICLQRNRTPEEYRDCIGEILETTTELTQVVEKLLMISRLHPASIRKDFSTIDLEALIKDTVSLYQTLLMEKRITLDQRLTPSSVQGDYNLLRQAVGNLIENAIKFTPEGKPISIHLGHHGDSIVIEVCDSGPGVTDSMMAHVKATENPARATDFETGRMGLVIVSEIMKLHHGMLKASSADNGGASVRLVWPDASAADRR